MSEQPPANPSDPEAGWVPRFGTTFLKNAALGLAGLFVLVVVVLFLAFGLDDERAAREATGLALLVLGSLALLGAGFFGLVEARTPPPPPPPPPVVESDPGRQVAPTVPVGKAASAVAEAFSGRKVSAVLFTIALVLFALGAAVTGGVSVSFDTTPAPSPTPTATPTS